MAAEEVDWDLNAVVRRFTTTTAADRTSSSSAVKSDDPLPILDVVGNGSQSQSSGPFDFPELLQPRSNGLDELQQLLRPFFISSDNNSSSNGANSSSYGRMYEQQGCAMNMLPQIMIQPPPLSTVIFPGGVFRGGNQPQPPVPVQSQTPRSRKRKNQVKKSVCHVTGENLSSDLWAWRKYGQKPIKGSPFPRNYYRCSSSKGCTARKQVEKSTTDQNVFIVTYTGEHSHPRPTHRNSLAGSTRNKFTNTLLKPTGAAPEPTPAGNEDFEPPIPAVSGLSPTTPLTVPVTSEEPVLSMEDMDDIDGMEEDDDLLIPNAMTSEDFFTFGASPYNSSGDNFPFSQS